MKFKKYMIYTSFLGFFLIGISFMISFFEKRQYSHLVLFWIRCLILLPTYLIISFTMIISKSYFVGTPALQYMAYLLCAFVVYILGVFSLKSLIKWKKKTEELEFFNTRL